MTKAAEGRRPWRVVLVCFAALIMAVGLVGACSSDGQPCKTSVDCRGLFCIDGQCIECTKASHCQDGKVCQAGKCVEPGREPTGDGVTPGDGGAEPGSEPPGSDTPGSSDDLPDVIDPPSDDPPVEYVPKDDAPVGPPPAVCEGRSNCCVPSQLTLVSSAEYVSSALRSYRPLFDWNHTGKVFVSATMNAGRIEIRDGTTFAYKRAWNGHPDGGILGIAINPAGTIVATASYDRTVKLWNVADGKLKATLTGHGSYVYDVAFSRDGKYVASAGIYDRTAKVWSVDTGKIVNTFKDSQYVYTVAFGKSSNQLILAGANRSASLWDVSTGKKIRGFSGNTSHVRAIDVSPDGTKVAMVGDDRYVRLFNVADGKLLASFSGHSSPIYDVRFSPDGKSIASGATYDLSTRIWDVATKTEVERFTHPTYPTRVRWSADGKSLLTMAYDKWVRRWTLGNQTPRKHLDLHYDIKASVAINAAGTKLVAAKAASATAQIIQLSDHKVLAELKGHGSYISDVAFSADGKWAVTSSWDKTVKIWNASSGALARTLSGHTGAVYALAISPSGQMIASGSSDRTIRISNLTTGKLLRTLKGHSGAIRGLAFSHDGKWLASGSSDAQVRLWDAASGNLLATMKDHQVGVYAVGFNRDSSKLVSGGWDRQIYVWNVPDGTVDKSWTSQSGLVRSAGFLADGSVISVSYDRYMRVRRLPSLSRTHANNNHVSMVTGLAIHPTKPIVYTMGLEDAIIAWRTSDDNPPVSTEGSPLSLAVSLDGKTAFVGLESGQIQLRELPSGTLLKTIDAHKSSVRVLRLSLDGQTLFSGSDDTTIKAWKVEDGSLLQTYEGHLDRVYGLDMHPGGGSFASGGFGGKVFQWDIASGKKVREYNGPVGQVYAVAFSPTGKLLAAGTYRKKAFIWNVGDSKVFKTFQSGMSGGVTSLAWVNETYLFTASFDGSIYQWRLSDDRRYRTLSSHEGSVLGLLVDPTNSLLYSASQDGTVRSWRISDGVNLRTATGHNDQVNALALDGSGLVSVSLDGSMRRWSSLTTNIADVVSLASKQVMVGGIGVSPDGKWGATGGAAGHIKHYAANDGKYLRNAATVSSLPSAIAFSHDSKLYAAGLAKYVYVWDATVTNTAKRTNTITTNTKASPNSVAFSSDGAMLLLASDDNNDIQRFRLKDNKLDGAIKGHTKPVFRLATDAKGSFLLSASKDQTIKLWSGSAWTPIRTLADLGGSLVSADLSSDASYIAAAIAPNTLKLYKATGGLHKSISANGVIARARFGGSGAWIAVGYQNGSVELFATSDLRSLQRFKVQSSPVTSLDAAASGRGLILGNASGYALGWRCP